MTKIIHFVYDWIVEFVVRLSGIVLVICIILQIFSRTLKMSLTWTDELARFSFIWYCLFGSILTLRAGLHLGIDYIENKMSAKAKSINRAGIHILTIIFGLFIGITGVQLLDIVKIQTSPIMGIPMAWNYVAVPLAGFLFALLAFNDLYNHFKGKKDSTI
jgi:TRAP-type C4-dicarboxylate transport system permease small subunit